MTAVASTAPIARRRLGFDLSKPVLLAFAAILFALIAMPLSWLVIYAFTGKSGPSPSKISIGWCPTRPISIRY